MNTTLRHTLNTLVRTAPQALAIAALGLGLAGTVHAGGKAPSVTVQVADLDVAKPAGAIALYQRLRAAAYSVCGYPVTGDLAAKASARLCVDETIHRAVLAFDHPAFSAWVEAKTGRAVRDARLASN